mmetsp:Transcript_8464/g.16188  ORF Transcript_8464/g.16188 Transcript_8464/m.16188 type:complete len:286 (+) Transcript_8464:45-902(+)
MEAKQAQLSQDLADLLGFDDGVEDVLEHLLTIESSEDLLDYLSQLLGSTNEKVQLFVDNVNAFQKGGSLTVSKPLPAAVEVPTPSHDVVVAAAKKNVHQKAVAAEVEKPPPPKVTEKQTNAPTETEKDATRAPAPTFQKETNPQDLPKNKEPKPPKKSKPQKGKASFVCGCFGTKHKPLANCLVCGRIACEREGYDFCPFCGILVERPPEGVSRTDPPWLHKERLLRFDRESTQRMVVIDDQSDYAATNQMAWLTQEETKEAEERQAEQEHKLRQRPKMQLNLGL